MKIVPILILLFLLFISCKTPIMYNEGHAYVQKKTKPVIQMNRDAFEQLGAEKKLEIIPGATHLFEEPGALEEVAKLARAWFARYLGARRDTRVA